VLRTNPPANPTTISGCGESFTTELAAEAIVPLVPAAVAIVTLTASGSATTPASTFAGIA
jgi:hypothetical protein